MLEGAKQQEMPRVEQQDAHAELQAERVSLSAEIQNLAKDIDPDALLSDEEQRLENLQAERVALEDQFAAKEISSFIYLQNAIKIRRNIVRTLKDITGRQHSDSLDSEGPSQDSTQEIDMDSVEQPVTQEAKDTGPYAEWEEWRQYALENHLIKKDGTLAVAEETFLKQFPKFTPDTLRMLLEAQRFAIGAEQPASEQSQDTQEGANVETLEDGIERRIARVKAELERAKQDQFHFRVMSLEDDLKELEGKLGRIRQQAQV